MSLINTYEFKKCVNRYKGDRHAIKFTCRDQFMVMSFAQFTDRSGLRDIETTLNLCSRDLYRSSIKVTPKSTLAKANEKKDWRIYQDFAQVLIRQTKEAYKGQKLRFGKFDSLFQHFHLNNAFFVTRAKENMLYEVIDSREVDQSAGLFSDETIKLTGPLTSKKYPDFS